MLVRPEILESRQLLSAVNLQLSMDHADENFARQVQIHAVTDEPVQGDQFVTVAVTGDHFDANDFTLEDAVIRIADGTTSGMTYLNIVDDDLVEAATETAHVAVAEVSDGLQLGQNTSAELIVHDNDEAILSVEGESVVESDQHLAIRLRLSSPVSAPVTALLRFSGSAQAGVDYEALPSDLVEIPAGATELTILLRILDDAEVERLETVQVTIDGIDASGMRVHFGPATTPAAPPSVEADEIQISPIDQTIVYRTDQPETEFADSGPGLFAIDPGQTTARRLDGPQISGVNVGQDWQFTPDGQYVIYTAGGAPAGTVLRKVEVATGRLIDLTFDENLPSQITQLSPAGDAAFYVRFDAELRRLRHFRLPLSGDAATELMTANSDDQPASVEQILLHPDGDRVFMLVEYPGPYGDRRAIDQFTFSTQQSVRLWASDIMDRVSEVSLTNDQRHLVFSAQLEWNKGSEFLSLNLDDHSVTQLTASNELGVEWQQRKWSPDRESILILAQDTARQQRLFSLRISIRQIVELTYAPAGRIDWFEFSPDGSRIVYRTPDELVSVLASGHEHVVLFEQTEGTTWNHQISPDSQTVIMTIDDKLSTIPITGGAPRTLDSENEVGRYEFVPGTDWIVYGMDTRYEDPFELFVATLDGQPPRKLGPQHPTGTRRHATRLTADGMHVIYAAWPPAASGQPASIEKVRISDGHSVSAVNASSQIDLPAGYGLTQPAEGVIGLNQYEEVSGNYLRRRISYDGTLLQQFDDTAERTLTPDGKHFVYSAQYPQDSGYDLYVEAVDGTSRRRLNGALLRSTSGPIDFLVAADGQHVIYAARQDRDELDFYSVPLTGGTSLRLNTDQGEIESVFDAWFSSDGDWIVYRGRRSGHQSHVELFAVPSAGGHAIPLSGNDGNTQRATQVQILPDNALLYVGGYSSSRRIYRIQLPQNHSSVAADPEAISPAGITGSLAVSADSDLLAYLRTDEDTTHLEVSDPNGNATRTLLSVPAESIEGELTVTENFIYFHQRTTSSNNTHLYRMRLDGTGDAEQVTQHLPEHLSIDELHVSPDGQKILAIAVDESGEHRHLYLIDVETLQQIPVSTIVRDPARIWYLQFTHDSQFAVFTVDGRFAIVPLSATATAELTDNDSLLPDIVAPTGSHSAMPEQLEWRGVAEATEYEVWLAEAGSQTPLLHTTVATTRMAAPELPGTGRYRLWVRGLQANGRPTAWTQSTFHYSVSVDVNIERTSPLDQQPRIDWPAVPGVDEYRLFIRNGTLQTTVVDSILPSSEYQPSADWPMGNYRVWVQPQRTGQSLNWSSPATYSISPQPTAPGPGIDQLRPQFEWTGFNNAASYDLYLRTPSGVITVSDLTATRWSPESDLPAGRITWWVRARSETGRPTSWSERYDTHIGLPVLHSPAPINTDGDPVASWNPIVGATTYEVYVARLDQWETPRRWTVEETSVELVPLPDGKYRVWVRALDGQSGPPRWGPAHDFEINTPIKRRIEARDGYTTSLRPRFDFGPFHAQPDARYELHLQNEGQTIRRTIDQPYIGWWADTDLAPGDWSWRVRVIMNDGRVGTWGTRGIVTVFPRPIPQSPSGTIANGRPTFSWSAVADTSHYELLVWEGGSREVLRVRDIQRTTYRPDISLPSGDYRFWVKAINSNGGTDYWSEAMEFRISTN